LLSLSFFVAFKKFQQHHLFTIKLMIMPTHENDQTTRRGFLGGIAAGAAALGVSTLSPLQQIHASPGFHTTNANDPAEDVFKNLKGKHRIVFDVVEAKFLFPFAWPRVFLLTNMATGTPEKDNNVVVVLRHESIPYAMNNDLWKKYNFAESFKVKDGQGNPVTSNIFWQPPKGTYQVPGFGVIEVGINELQASGVQFVVCNAAMTVYSAMAAGSMNAKPEDVLKEWKAGVLPGITVVPSGVWAVGRAQEHQCAYCYAG
jgi:intracellular sulfur oxidation DsrE/DsrF family protein